MIHRGAGSSTCPFLFEAVEMSQYATIVRKLKMESNAMAEQREHPLNRHLFIADNLNLLRALD